MFSPSHFANISIFDVVSHILYPIVIQPYSITRSLSYSLSGQTEEQPLSANTIIYRIQHQLQDNLFR